MNSKIQTCLLVGNFHQPSEVSAAAMGVPGADMLGTRDFFGVISCVEDVWSGQMKDHWGPSILTAITLDLENEFRFSKKYRNRNDVITYSFRWNATAKWWEGDWKIYEDDVELDWGLARLYLVPTSPDFFAYNGVTVVV